MREKDMHNESGRRQEHENKHDRLRALFCVTEPDCAYKRVHVFVLNMQEHASVHHYVCVSLCEAV